VLRIRKHFFRIRIHTNFFRIRILQTYILGQTIPKFSFNGFWIQYYEEKFWNCRNMCFFSFNSSICHALLLNYSVWIRIRIFFRIRQKVSDSFGFGSATLGFCNILYEFAYPELAQKFRLWLQQKGAAFPAPHHWEEFFF
jgi:hypothetical protein